MRTCLALAIVVAGLWPAAAQSPPDRDAVVAVVQRFFDAMGSRDAAAMKTVLMTEGSFFSVREDGSVRATSIKDWIDRLPSGKEKFLERMWNPEVKVHRGIAVVWTPYDFYRDGKFSHCGVDAFDLVKTPAGWKISGGTFTIEKSNCPPSPLGPPK
jgi:hypothetical protein